MIVQDGMRRMYQDQQEVFYYITVTNENYRMPAMPAGVEEGIVRGMYLLKAAAKPGARHAQLLGSGAILREVLAAVELLAELDITADVWSVTSFTELAREAEDVRRRRRLQPEAATTPSYVEQALGGRPQGPVIAATDYMKLYAEQIRAAVPRPYVVLGTDGFGRSDTREDLRHFFEVDRKHIAYATVDALVESGVLDARARQDAQHKLGIDPNKPNPARL